MTTIRNPPAPETGRHWRAVAFWGAILLGGLLRFVALGVVPAGLNADEASSGVEALSILTTGMDRWGNHLPVWFPAWGSGMNALYSYIAVPIIWLFGLDTVTLRAIGAVFGVMTLPVAWAAARMHFNRDTALATLWLLAILPWHVMSSRWALDSNLVPFWFTLGLVTLGKAVTSDRRIWPILAFAPWAISVYAYPVSIIPIVASGVAILFFYRGRVVADAGRWAAGLGLAFIIDLPFMLFLAKNQFGVTHIPFESRLPFSIPTLLVSRLNQIRKSLPQTLYDNVTFILGGYRDGAVWHQSIYFLPLTGGAPYLTLIGVATLAFACVKRRQPNIVLLVALSAAVPIMVHPLNVTRLNWFYIPSLMIIAELILTASRTLYPKPFRSPILWGSFLYVFLFVAAFYPYYFIRYNDEILVEDATLGNGFRVGLESALHTAADLSKPGEPIFIDAGKVHPYLYVLFYGLSDIRRFQATRQLRIEDNVYHVVSFDRFVFDRDAVNPDQPFIFVTLPSRLPCPAPENLQPGPLWAVGRCAPG